MQKRILLTLTILLLTPLFLSKLQAQNVNDEYVYLIVEGKLGKKLSVEYDFGTHGDIELGRELNRAFKKIRSYIEILEIMEEKGYELVQAFDYIDLGNGNGGSSGIQYLMRKKE